MATKVNTKFIAILSAAIVALVAGAGGLFVFSQLKSAERNVQHADQLDLEADATFTAGNEAEGFQLRQQAMKQRGVAVNKQPNNLQYLEAWRDAILETRPESRDVYEQNFGEYLKSINAISNLRDDLQSRTDFVMVQLEQSRRYASGARAASNYSALAESINDAVQRTRITNDDHIDVLEGLRAWATVRQMLATSVDDDAREEAREDLDNALVAIQNIDDTALAQRDKVEELLAEGRITWVAGEVRSQLNDSRPTLAIETFNEQAPTVQQIADTYPGSVAVQASHLRYVFGRPDARALSPEQLETRTARIDDLKDRVLDAALQLQPEDADLFAINDAVSFGSSPERVEEFVGFVRTIPERFDSDAGSLAIAASILEARNDLDAAEAIYQQITEMPMPTISSQGRDLTSRRILAKFSLGNIAIKRFRGSTEPGTRQQALAQAKAIRDEADQASGVAFENELKLLDANINLIEQNYNAARALFSEVQRDLGISEPVLIGLARCAAALGNLSAATDYYEQLVAGRPIGPGGGIQSLEYALELADVYARAGNVEGAIDQIQKASAVLDADQLAQREARLRAILAEELRADINDLETQLAEDPTNRDVLNQIAELNAELQRVSEGVELPQEILCLGEAQRANEAEGIDAAIAILERCIQNNPDSPELRVAYVRSLAAAQRMDDAERAANEAVQLFPNTRALQQLQIAIENRDQDPYTVQRNALTDQFADDTAQRNIELARLALAYRNLEDAERDVNQALQAEPQNGEAVEIAFTIALAKRPPDLDAAQELADLGATVNADNLDGRSFEARLAGVNGDLDRAIELFRESTELIPSEPRLWRLLGNALTQAGRTVEALDAYETALQGRANDIITVQAYATTLQSLGRPRQALAAIGPDSDVFSQTRSIPSLRNLWLQLEASVGNTDLAIREREAALQSRPTDAPNALALFDLYINTERTDDARRMIDTLQQNEAAFAAFAQNAGGAPDLTLARINAIITATEGDPISAARQFQEQLPALAASSGDATPYVSFADFALALSAANPDLAGFAFDALQQGRSVQTPEQLEADTAIARSAQTRALRLLQAAGTLQAAGNPAAAETARQRAIELNNLAADASENIIASGNIQGRALDAARIQLARIRLQLDDLDAAATVLDRVLTDNPENLEALLLKADTAQRSGDTDTARDTLDAAIAAHPNDHRPFRARAIINASDNELYADVIADLDAVHRLRPDDTLAWRLRVQVALRRAQATSAFAKLQETIEDNSAAAPQLKRTLVELYRTSGQADLATDTAISYADDDPEDLYWQSTAGQLAANADRFRDAARCFRRLYDSPQLDDNDDRRAAAAAGLLDAILRTQAAPIAGELLQLLDAIEPLGDDNTAVVMLRARTQEKLGNRDAALSLVREALGKAGTNLAALRAWRDALPLVIGEADAARFVNNITRAGQAPLFLRLADIRSRRASLPLEQVEQETADLIEQAQAANDTALIVEVARFRLGVLYALSRYEEAVELGKLALQYAPNDPQLNNDTGFILAVELDRPQDALPLAEAAYAVSQEDAAILDTVGAIYRLTGKLQDAERVLLQARQRTGSPDLLLAINIHLAKTYIDMGNNSRAQDAYERALRALRNASEVSQNRYTDELNTISQTIG